MKKQFILLLLAVTATVFTGCNDEEEVTPPAAITITQSDIPNSDGFVFQRTDFDLNAFVAPTIEGENLTWDLSNIPTAGSRNTRPMFAVNDPAAGSSNLGFVTITTNVITQQEVSYNALREINAEGIYATGAEYTEDVVVPIFGGAGTLSFVKGYFLNTPKYKLLGFPANYGDTHQVSTTTTEDFIADYPAAGLNNVPANTVDNSTGTVSIVGWGSLKLPGYTKSFEVLAVKSDYVNTRTYLLGGQPAPATLLAGLGLTDGEQSSTSAVEFYTREHGRIVLYGYNASGALDLAYFRSDIPE